MTDVGPVNMEVGSRHFIRKSEVEYLIKQGYVEHIVDA